MKLYFVTVNINNKNPLTGVKGDFFVYIFYMLYTDIRNNQYVVNGGSVID